jgi:transcriptional regulator with XRE-family HTH domain
MGDLIVKLREWHRRELARNADYARAAQEIDFAQTLADIVVEARLTRGWAQEDLAGRAGTTQARISELERGTGNPTANTITRVLSALGAPAVTGVAQAFMPWIPIRAPSGAQLLMCSTSFSKPVPATRCIDGFRVTATWATERRDIEPLSIVERECEYA